MDDSHNRYTTSTSPKNHSLVLDDLLWRHLKTVPVFRGLLRSVEARFFQQIELPNPILDLGCGDGHFANLTFNEPLLAGIDPWWGPLKKAQKSEAYRMVLQASGHKLPFSDSYFGSVISNSVLEHIPALDPVLLDISRVLKPGGKLVVTMPSHYFTEYLGGAQWLERHHMRAIADSYRHLFNRIARHAHTDAPEIWMRRFAKAGLEVERWQYYFSEQALHVLEIGHLQGLPSAIIHLLTGHWIIAPWKSNLSFVERWVRPYFEEAWPSIGTMLFFIAHKVSDTSIDPILPPAQPFEFNALSNIRSA